MLGEQLLEKSIVAALHRTAGAVPLLKVEAHASGGMEPQSNAGLLPKGESPSAIAIIPSRKGTCYLVELPSVRTFCLSRRTLRW